jgi:hypothetical protein
MTPTIGPEHLCDLGVIVKALNSEFIGCEHEVVADMSSEL